MFKPLMVYEAWANFSLMTSFHNPAKTNRDTGISVFLGFLFLDY